MYFTAARAVPESPSSNSINLYRNTHATTSAAFDTSNPATYGSPTTAPTTFINPGYSGKKTKFACTKSCRTVEYPWFAMSRYQTVSATPQMSSSGRCDVYTHTQSTCGGEPSRLRAITPMRVKTTLVPRRSATIYRASGDIVNLGGAIGSLLPMSAAHCYRIRVSTSRHTKTPPTSFGTQPRLCTRKLNTSCLCGDGPSSTVLTPWALSVATTPARNSGVTAGARADRSILVKASDRGLGSGSRCPPPGPKAYPSGILNAMPACACHNIAVASRLLDNGTTKTGDSILASARGRRKNSGSSTRTAEYGSGTLGSRNATATTPAANRARRRLHDAERSEM